MVILFSIYILEGVLTSCTYTLNSLNLDVLSSSLFTLDYVPENIDIDVSSVLSIGIVIGASLS
jgi:hypothetical protein